MTIFVRNLFVATVALSTAQAQAEDREGAIGNFVVAFAAWVEAKEREDVCGFSWFGYGEIRDTIDRASVAFLIDGDVAGNTLEEELEITARIASNAGYAAAVEGPCQVRQLARDAGHTEEVMIEILEAVEEQDQ